ncbi:MAG: PKD-like family lipoprotein [Chitinophagaceae bacterium]
MKQFIRNISILTAFAAFVTLAGCYKDKGNYSYNEPETPLVTNLDTLYKVLVGDSLIIAPEIKMETDADLMLTWKISVVSGTGAVNRDVLDTGASMRIVFGLEPKTYTGRLTIHNNTNGMKYFHNFKVESSTEFATGTTILTEENGRAQLSFVRPDGSLQARLFQAVNPDVPMPENPTQLVAAPLWTLPNTVETYWVFGKGGVNTGVQVDANTFIFKKTLADNFFDKPEEAIPGKMFAAHTGILTGIVNGRLYAGSTNTWNLAPVYGMFSSEAVGDYDLSPHIAYVLNDNPHMPGNPYLGYDKTKKRFIWFVQTGAGPNYMGINYGVAGDAFDPTNVGLDLIHIQQIAQRSGICFAYGKDAAGDIWELKMDVKLSPGDISAIQVIHKRKFVDQSLITASTTWQATEDQILFLTKGDKIYKYNPINQEIVPLQTNFSGQEVSIIKTLDNGNTLIAGTIGKVYYLDVSTGKMGDIKKTIDNLPGKPIGLVQR